MQISSLKNLRNLAGSHSGIWLMLGFFACVYGLLSLVNHACFRSFALDLGMFNQALYAYAHGEPAYFTQGIGGEKIPYLCDHFSPALIVFAPLYYLLGSYALLVVQIFFVCLMIWSSWRIALLRGLTNAYALAVAAYCGGLWGIWAALSYDFHMNVLLASLLLPLYLLYHLRRKVSFVLLSLFALLLKENAGFVLAFFFAALWLKQGRGKSEYLLPILSLLAFGFFVLVLFYLGPAQCQGHTSNSAKLYGAFGNSFGEAIQNMLRSPLDVLRMLIYEPSGKWAKTKETTWWFLLLSGGFLFLRYPVYFIMLIPVIAQKFLASDGVLWDINRHYSIEFVPPLVLALIDFSAEKSYLRARVAVVPVCVVMAFFMSWRGIISRGEQSNIFSVKHYSSGIDAGDFSEVKKMIPEEAILSASANLSPHLSSREVVYVFPDILDADFVVLDKTLRYTFPFSNEEMEGFIQKLRADGSFEMILDKREVCVFRKMDKTNEVNVSGGAMQ